MRRRSLTLSIIDYYYLAVRMTRGNSVSEYVLDLRFIDTSKVLTRHVPWRFIGAALALTGLAAVDIWLTFSDVVPLWGHISLRASAGLLAATLGVYVIVMYRLIESLALRTIHGRATVLDYRGGPGTLRIARPFMRKLAAHSRLAISAHQSTNRKYLRDELREHYRLKEAGVLPPEVYNACKERILALHAHIRPND